MKRSKRSDSNLFAIDYDAIRTTLADANEPLIKRCKLLLQTFSDEPESMEFDGDVRHGIQLTKQLKSTIKEASSARLSDGRPFQNAVATVKDFFGEIEGPLKNALAELEQRLTHAAIQTRPTASSLSDTEPTALGTDVSGETIVTSNPHSSENENNIHEEINLVWSVKNFDRQNLELESLRPYLTDHALMLACNKHLADNGPHELAGVQYEELAKSQHF